MGRGFAAPQSHARRSVLVSLARVSSSLLQAPYRVLAMALRALMHLPCTRMSLELCRPWVPFRRFPAAHWRLAALDSTTLQSALTQAYTPILRQVCVLMHRTHCRNDARSAVRTAARCARPVRYVLGAPVRGHDLASSPPQSLYSTPSRVRRRTL